MTRQLVLGITPCGPMIGGLIHHGSSEAIFLNVLLPGVASWPNTDTYDRLTMYRFGSQSGF